MLWEFHRWLCLSFQVPNIINFRVNVFTDTHVHTHALHSLFLEISSCFRMSHLPLFPEHWWWWCVIFEELFLLCFPCSSFSPWLTSALGTTWVGLQASQPSFCSSFPQRLQWAGLKPMVPLSAFVSLTPTNSWHYCEMPLPGSCGCIFGPI